jgi:hypothetical protein
VGGTVLESQEQLDVFSVALSNDGETLAVGGVPATKDGVVAKVFCLFAGDWEELESGIYGLTAAIRETIYLAEISGDGNTIVVSNCFTTDTKANAGLQTWM